jgi:hypothetical protein
MQYETQILEAHDPATRGYSRTPIRALGTILDHAESHCGVEGPDRRGKLEESRPSLLHRHSIDDRCVPGQWAGCAWTGPGESPRVRVRHSLLGVSQQPSPAYRSWDDRNT